MMLRKDEIEERNRYESLSGNCRVYCLKSNILLGLDLNPCLNVKPVQLESCFDRIMNNYPPLATATKTVY